MSIPLTVDLAWRVLCSEEMLEAIHRWARRSSEPRRVALDDELGRALHSTAWLRLGEHRPEQIDMAAARLRYIHRRPHHHWPIYGDSSTGESVGAWLHEPGAETGGSLLSAAMTELARRFLVDRGMGIALRPDTLDELQRVAKYVECNQIESFCWATGAHTSRPWLNELSAEALLARARGPLLPTVAEPLIEALTEKGLAEVHRHFNGSASPMLLWTHLLQRYHQLAREYHCQVNKRTQRGSESVEAFSMARQLSWLRQARWLREALLARLHAISAGYSASHEHAQQYGDVWRGAVVRLLSLPTDTLRSEALNIQAGKYWSWRIPWLLGRNANLPIYVRQDLVGERALLYRLFLWLKHGRDITDVERAAVHAYLLVQNLTLASLKHPVDGRSGLRRFAQDYAGARAREVSESDYEERLVQASRTGAVRWLEARLSPSGNPRAKLRKLDYAARRRRNAQQPQDVLSHWRARHAPAREQAASVPEIGVIFHFIRKMDCALPRRARPHPIRHAVLRTEVWKQAHTLLAAWRDPAVGHLLVGLDIAGKETDAPNEVFAPAIRFLRAAVASPLEEIPAWRRPRSRSGLHPSPLRLTCHAGEDFDHLISGMRAVDEALTFLEMEPGDRIGHGLALGYWPRDWAEACGGTIHHHAGPWLDDLVWFRSQLLDVHDYGVVVADVDTRIADLAFHIYGRDYPEASSVNLLEQAWRWRKEDPNVAKLLDDTTGMGRRDAVFLPGSGSSFGRYSLNERGYDPRRPEVALWRAYEDDVNVRRRGQETLEVSIPERWLPAMERVQEQMLAKLCTRRIAIEINPSSNLSIGFLRDMREHPVFRWLGPEMNTTSAPFVTVGSDDPGIFATELVHEYAFLASAAARRGASPLSIQSWLEHLRQTSIDFSFIKMR